MLIGRKCTRGKEPRCDELLASAMVTSCTTSPPTVTPRREEVCLSRTAQAWAHIALLCSAYSSTVGNRTQIATV
jgi:hypothetical protein